MAKICGIYKITNIINNKLYIGRSLNIEKRWYSEKHMLKNNKFTNNHLQNAWNQYGEENFIFEIVLECPAEQLNEEEIRLIKKYNAIDRNFGYNIKEGGGNSLCAEETKIKIGNANRGRKLSKIHKQQISKFNKGKKIMQGKHHTEESKKKMSEIKKGRKLSDITKNKISKALKSDSNPWKGKHHTEETKRKLSEISKNISEETRKKMSESQKGRIHSEETRKKMSNAHKNISEKTRKERAIARSMTSTGHNNPFYGKKHSEETKRKMSETKLRNKIYRLIP